MAKHNDFGKRGEMLAKEYLLSQQIQILHENWRIKNFEIDLVATDDEFIIFVEVKARTSRCWGNPEDAVSEVRQKRMIEAANYYIEENEITLPVRFDIIAITGNEDKMEIEHFDDAFLPSLN